MSTGTLTIVVENLLDEVNMREDHTTAAVAPQTELSQSFAFVHVVLQQLEVLVPLVAHDLATTEATDLVPR